MRLKKPRLNPVAESSMTHEQNEIVAPLRKRYGFVFNVLKTMMHNMPLLEAWNPLAGHIMGASSLSPRLREIVIMRVALRTNSEYEWGQHVLMSKEADLDEEDHNRICAGADAPGWTASERAVLLATDELIEVTMLSDEVWSALCAEFEEAQILDFIFTVGQYNMLAMALNSLGVQRESGVPGFPDGLDGAS